jgi:hypothetical protein
MLLRIQTWIFGGFHSSKHMCGGNVCMYVWWERMLEQGICDSSTVMHPWWQTYHLDGLTPCSLVSDDAEQYNHFHSVNCSGTTATPLSSKEHNCHQHKPHPVASA